MEEEINGVSRRAPHLIPNPKSSHVRQLCQLGLLSLPHRAARGPVLAEDAGLSPLRQAQCFPRDRVAIPRATAVKAWTKLEEACRARPFEQIDEYLSREDPLPSVLESTIEALSSQPRSKEAGERITKLKDRLRKIRKKERTKRE